MTDEHLHEDPVLQLVLRTRPPISDEDLSPDGDRATAILERILGARVASTPARRRRAFVAVLLPVLGVAALVLLIAGVFSGPASTGTQPAIAAVIRGVEKATALKPGTIVVSKYRVSYRNRAGQPARFTIETIYETPAGSGPQNSLYVNSEHISGQPTEQAINGGNGEVYLSKTNTVYISSIWGSQITKGKKPGTFIYRPVNPPPGVRSATLPARPLALTAQQAHALLDGSATVSSIPIGSHIPYRMKLEVMPVVHFPSDVQAVRGMLKSHGVRVIGLTTVNGHRAIELAGPKFNPRSRESGGGDAGVRVWVDPKTYVPIKEVIDRRPLFEEAQTWIEYKTLPSTPANERLLSLTARHPHARIDRNHKHYLKAANGDAVFTG
jgi:hypothetical protein